MARPDMLKLVADQQANKASTNNALNGMTSKGFKTDDSTKFNEISGHLDYINPENRGESSARGFDFSSDYDKSRALNQTKWEQTSRTAGKLIPKTILEFVSQVGNVADLEDYNNSDTEVGNWLSNWAQEQKQELDENYPTFRENPNAHLDTGDYAWWMQNGSSLVESASAFVALGYLTGGASMKALTKGGKALEWLGAIGKGARATDATKKGTRLAAGLANTLMLNQAEGVGIAANVYQDVYAKTLAELKAKDSDMPEEAMDKQAKLIASERASSVINYNRANILLNLTSSFAFLKAPNLTRQTLKAASLKTTAKRTLGEGLQEAAEESVNLVSEKQAYDKEYDLDKAIADVATKEGAESAILGFVGGAGQTMLTSAGRNLKTKRDNEGNRFSRNDAQNKRFFEQQESLERISTMDKASKLSDVTDVYNKSKETYELYRELEDASRKGDFAKVEEIKNTLLSVQAYDAFANGTTDQYIGIFKGVKELTPEEAEEKGLDKNTYIEDSNTAIKRIENLEKEYNKAQGYKNFNEVYDNRSKSLGMKDAKTDLEATLFEERAQVMEDAKDLGIKEELIEVDDNGTIKFTNFTKYGDTKKANLNNLTSLREYKDTKDRLTKLNGDIRRNSIQHIKLTSDQEQERVTNVIKEERRKAKAERSEKQVQKKQREKSKKNKATAKKYEKEIVNTDKESAEATAEARTDADTGTAVEDDVDTVDTIEDTAGFTFEFTGQDLQAAQEGSNVVFKSDKTIAEKITKFKELIEKFEPFNNNAPPIAGAIAQYNKAIAILEEQEASAKKNEIESTTASKKADEDMNDALADLAPAVESDELDADEKKLIEQKRKVRHALGSMEEAGYDISDFRIVAEFTQNAVGKAKFVRIFDEFKALYNLTKVGEASNLTYGDIFYDESIKRKIVSDKYAVDVAKAFAELYAMSDLDFNKEENKVLREYIEKQGYVVHRKENVTSGDIKVKEGHNKLAHLDKKYKVNVKIETTGTFNVLDFVTSKSDLDNELNDNASQVALDFDKFNVGDKITFVVLDEVVYDDGSIAYSDGRVEKDGEVTQLDAIEEAPIGILFNGEILQGHYLHTVSWVNENNIADYKDVRRQKENLTKIRKAIIESTAGVSSTVRERSNGHFMRDVNGTTATITENLPNVEIGIGKDGGMYTGANEGVEVDNDLILDGALYAIMPVNKDVKYAMPIKRDTLGQHPIYVKSIIEAVKLYLTNNRANARVMKLEEETGIDITSINGLQTYLEKFLFLNPKLDMQSFKFDKFSDYVENHVQEDASIIRILTNKTDPNKSQLEFGRGANVGDTIGFINRSILNNLEGEHRTKSIKAYLRKLENVLNNNTNLNINKDNFNKEFQLPIITEQEVTVTEQPYNKFVKDHATTDLYSYTLEDGKEIYTVQANIEFDTTFAFKPTVVDEVHDVPSPHTLGLEVEGEEVTGFDVFEDVDEDIDDDFAPRVLSEQEQQEYEASIPESLFVKGVSINLQEIIIDNLTSNVLKELHKNPDSEDAFDVIDNFVAKEVEFRLRKLNAALETDLTEEQEAKIRKNIEVAESVKKEFNKIVFLVLDNIRQYHGLIKSGKKFDKLKDSLDSGEITFDDIGELLNEEGELKEYNNWDSDSAFRVDFKRQLGQEVKNYFSYIEDVREFKVVDGKRAAIPKLTWGLPVTVPFDQVVNELSGILAYSNYQDETKNTTIPTFDSMYKTIEEWVEAKPFLHNVLIELDKADEQMRNKFIGVMSKSYTHHINLFKNKEGNIFLGTSDSTNMESIIQKEWLSNMYNSPLIETVNNEFIVNGNEVDAVTRKSKDLVTILQSNVDEVTKLRATKALLDSLGLVFPKKLIKTLHKEGVFYNKKRFGTLRLITESDGAINVLLKRLNAIKDKNAQENNPLANTGALGKFSRQIGKLHPVYFTNSFKDVRGRTYYGYSANKFLTDRTKTLKTNDKGILDKLSEQPFSKDSYWVRQFKNNPKFREHFGYFTFDGRSKEGAKGKKLEHMSPAEVEETKLALFYANQKHGKNFILHLLYPTTSDKSVSYGLRTLGADWNRSINNDNQIGNRKLDWLLDNLVAPEVNRILALQDTPNRWDIKAYAEGGTMFNMIPSLNALESIWIQDGEVRKLDKDVLTDGALREALKQELNTFITILVDNKINAWESYGFIKETEDVFYDDNGTARKVIYKSLKYDPDAENSVKSSATHFVVNYLIANVNTYQTFITDPAFYWKSKHWQNVAQQAVSDERAESAPASRAETLQYYTLDDWIQEHEDLFDNMGKRLGADAAPGKDLPNSPNEMFKLGIIADSERPAYLMDYYNGLLGNKAEGYMRVNSTDAQEFTTLAEHLHILQLEGKINKEEEAELNRKDNANEELTQEELQVILQPVKPVYVQNVWNDGVEHRLYVKSSSFPLFKQLTKGLELDKLRLKMVAGNFDRVAFESAVKIGGVANPSQVYQEGAENLGKINPKAEISIVGETGYIPREGWKIQQDMPYKESDYINDGSQQRTLLTATVRTIKGFRLSPDSADLVTGARVQAELDKKYQEYYEIGYKGLIKELDFNTSDGTINMKKLQKVLKDEALSRKYPLYDIEALSLRNNKFIVPLWLTGVSGKLEAMLNSIVDNRVRKLKPKGKSYILGTAEGFRVVEGKDADNFMHTEEGIVYDKTWYEREDKQLLPMRIEDANGVLRGAEGFDEATATMKPAEILVPFNFKDESGKPLKIEDFMTEDNQIDMTKIDERLLNLFGFRIPTQGLNSMAQVKIVGFLPKRSGDLFIAPADWTIQMGSDFDIDKLFTNSYNTTYTDGKLTKYSGEDRTKQLQDDILGLHFSITSSTDADVQAKILAPLDLGNLPAIMDEIYPHVDNRLKGISISEEYQSYKYRNARAAKSGIGVFSVDSTFLASIQGKGIILQRPIKGGWASYGFALGGQYSNNLSEPTTNTGSGRGKSDIISSIQSLAVDNENEQGMHKLNINKHTFDAIRTLALSGFEEDTIFYFLNQPIVRRYVELLIKAKDTATTYKEDQIQTDLYAEFPLSDPTTTVPELFSTYSSPTNREMLDMIQKPEPSNDVQRALYLRFRDVSDYGKRIQGVQSAINTSSAGVGKDLFYSSAKEVQLIGLPDMNRVAGADRLIGNYITLDSAADGMEKEDSLVNESGELFKLGLEWKSKTTTNKRKLEILATFKEEGYVPVGNAIVGGQVKDRITLIKPTTINGFASVYGLLLNNQIWGQDEFFPYNLNAVQSVIFKIKSVTNERAESIQENADINRKVFSSIKSFLATKNPDTYTDGTVQDERARLLMDNKDNKSIATILDTLKKTRKLSNAFVNRVHSEIRKELLPSNVTYNSSVAENINERAIYAAASQMLTDGTTDLGEFNGIQYTPKKIMQDLIAHQLLTGGVQKAKHFIKYIPINYLKSTGYYDGITNLDLNNDKDFDIDALVTQYAQHNPGDVQLTKNQTTNYDANYTAYNNGTILHKSITVADNLPVIFSVPNDKAVSGYTIYKKVQVDNQVHWEQIDTLGYKGIMEYDANAAVGTTLLPANKTTKVTEITLPKSEKEVDTFLTINTNTSEDPQVISDPTIASVSDYYDLKSNQTSTTKFAFILNKIATTSSNKYNAFLAQELHNNLDKIKDYKLIVDSSLRATGSHNLKDKTIKINPKLADSVQEFEDVILEEIIHAYTKKAILANTSGEVARLKSLRLQAIDIVSKHLGGTEDKFKIVARKIENGIPLNDIEANLIYPLYNDVEFVGRLFKSKELQELLNNTPSDVEGKSILDKFFDMIVELLNSIGIDIKKGSALEYATVDIISLINQPPPSNSIKGEMQSIKKVIRTPDFIYSKFNLKFKNDKLKKVPKGKESEIVAWINDNVTNLNAKVENGYLIITDKDTPQVDDQFLLDLAPEVQKTTAASNLLISVNNRIATLEDNIQKAEQRQDFTKVEELKDVMTELIHRRDGLNAEGEFDESKVSIMAIKRLSEVATKGEQDMQEIEEMLSRKVTVEDTLYIRKVLHYWTTAKNRLFTEDEEKSTKLVERFDAISSTANIHENTLVVIENDYMEGLMKKYGNNMTVEDVFNFFKDINGMQRDFLDISRSNNPMLDSVFLLVKDANIDALDDTREILSELEDMENKVRPILKGMGHKELYDIFRQRTAKGNITGHLVNRYATKYSKDAQSVRNILKEDNTYLNYDNLLEWAKDNSKQINLEYLFPIAELDEAEQVKANAYIKELQEELGAQHFGEFMAQQAKLIERYENFRQGRRERIADKYNIEVEDIASDSGAMREMTNWTLINSPYQYYRDLANDVNNRVLKFKNFNSPDFIVQVPKEESGYDANFKTIEGNQSLLEFYNYYTKVDAELKTYLPARAKTQLAFEGIPYVQKVLFEEYKDKGMKVGLAPILDGMKKAVRTDIEGNVSHKFVDPVTEIEEKRLGVNLTANNSQEYFDYLNTKTIEHQLEHGKAPSKAQLQTWSEEIINTLSQQKSYDLPKILRVYALTVQAYRHKARIEDSVKLAQNVLKKQREQERSKKGDVLTDGYRPLEPKSAATSFINTKQQFEHFTQVFYGKTKDNEGVTDTKVYTKEEKQRKANYEALLDKLDEALTDKSISQAEHATHTEQLQDQIDALGGVAVWSKRGDNLLKYVQLKSMGWNVMSSIANIGFGFIANKIESAGGRHYTSKQLTKAYRLTWDSLMKNWTFNKYETANAKKIRSMMDKWDVLKDATHELFQNPMNIELSKDKKWLSPYNLTQRTEYLNQAPTMIALMMNTGIDGSKDLSKGTMWDAYGIDGQWDTKYGEEPEKVVKKLRHTIDQINKRNHGNYDSNSPLRIKNKFTGRAISQFRTWMFEGVAARFESYGNDPLLGEKKGRYISVLSYFKAVGAKQGTIDTVQGILRALTFGKLFGEQQFERDATIEGQTLKEIDAENMRKVMMEVVLLMGTYTSYLMLSTIAGNLDDEDDRAKKIALNILINQGIRLKTDIMFYLHPGEFRSLLRDLIPAVSVVKDGLEWIDAVADFAIGEDEIGTGVYAGHSRLLRETMQALPLGTQVYKNINYSVQTFDK